MQMQMQMMMREIKLDSYVFVLAHVIDDAVTLCLGLVGVCKCVSGGVFDLLT